MRNFIIRVSTAISVSFVCYGLLYITNTMYADTTFLVGTLVIISDLAVCAVLRDEDNTRRVVEEYNQRVRVR